MIKRVLSLVAASFLLASCSASRERDINRQMASEEARRCVQENAEAIAPQNVDLETAVQAVMARCYTQITAFEREMISRYPGYRDQMAPGLRRVREVHEDAARQFIALARTRGMLEPDRRK